MINGIGIPSSQSKMGMFLSLSRATRPCSVSKPTAFGRSQASRKSPDQQRCREPKGKLHCSLASSIGSGLGIIDDFGNALVSVGFAQTGASGHDFIDVSAIGRLQLTGSEVRGHYAGQFAARISTVAIAGGCRWAQ